MHVIRAVEPRHSGRNDALSIDVRVVIVGGLDVVDLCVDSCKHTRTSAMSGRLVALSERGC